MKSSYLVFDTIAISTLRSALFFSCRRFVQSGLQQQLQHASNASLPEEDVELDVLPPPSAAPATPSHKIALDSSLHSVASRALFSICFSESCVLFVMLMCQALDIFTPSSRLFNWRISLFVLLSAILVVIPISMSFVSTSALRTSSGTTNTSWIPSFSRGLTVGLPLLIYFVLLSYVPLPTPLAGADGPFLFSSALPRLTVLGVGLLGSLSGFGSVTTSWGHFPFLCGSRRKSPSQAQVSVAEESLSRIRGEIDHKRAEIATMSRRAREQAEASPKNSSWVSRITPNFRGDTELGTLKTEVESLSALEDNMASQVRWLRQQYAEASFDRTWQGQFYGLLRRATGIYVLFRSFTSLANIILPVTPKTNASSDSNYPDLLTSILTFLLSILPIDLATLSAAQEGIPSVLRQINLLVVGIIIWSSLRRVLRGVTRALRVTGRTRVASFVLLVLAQIMSIYLLSTLIQLRTSFPPPIPSASPSDPGEITNLFATLPEYQFFGPVFDWSFLVSTGGAAFAEWLKTKAREDID
ncbi:Abscisic acid G-protein coupled receptor-domain-containing protein [Amylostereum chailletii]|nr:Abscisic acid G-protein coupled receptor-domain-containing protein [Amylostereum chailletii]